MQQFAKAALVALLLGLSGSLQGCGCDEDGAAKCAGGVDCAGISTYSKCIDDAGCCDYEKDGAKMKDTVAALFTIASCTTTNECA
jgi:hypothetical protein